MNAVRVRKHLHSHVLDLPELGPMVGRMVEIIVLEEPEPVSPVPPRAGPRAGSAKGITPDDVRNASTLLASGLSNLDHSSVILEHGL